MRLNIKDNYKKEVASENSNDGFIKRRSFDYF